ncbi:hypothetical protein [Luteococcus japonicus]|uniref:hypothetical protein n=1 Tax=Luteococcus japonicus TaxID=33984 RepID=UPI000B9B6193|nr:hypothetical protein [Luteococcus japonicus]
MTKQELRTAAHTALSADLTEALELGCIVPCLTGAKAHRDRWVSADAEEREAAARDCAGCPCTAACLRAGAYEVPGAAVWGGTTFPKSQPKEHR